MPRARKQLTAKIRSLTSPPSEAKFQCTVCNVLDEYAPYGIRYAAVPNGGKRRPKEAAQLKNQGVQPGFPDLLILIAPFAYGNVRAPASRPKSLYVELKTEDGTLSAEQIEWRDWLKSNGFLWAEWRTIDDVHATLKPLIGARAAA